MCAIKICMHLLLLPCVPKLWCEHYRVTVYQHRTSLVTNSTCNCLPASGDLHLAMACHCLPASGDLHLAMAWQQLHTL